jgi:hypothetical protein
MLLRRILQAMRRLRLRKRAVANFFSPPQKHGTRPTFAKAMGIRELP